MSTSSRADFLTGPSFVSSFALPLAFITISYLAYLTFILVTSTTRPRNYPPGPAPIPVFGNAHQIPTRQPYLAFTHWAQQYGPIIGLKLANRNLVVISDPAIVRELFDRRGAIYSGRPIPNVGKMVCSGGEPMAGFLQYGPYLKRWKTAIRSVVSPAGLKSLRPLQEREASSLVRAFLDLHDAESAEKAVHAVDSHGDVEIVEEGVPPALVADTLIKRWAIGLPLRVVAGQRLSDLPPSFTDDYHREQKYFFSLFTPGTAPLVEVLPFLRFFPGSWKKKIAHVRAYIIREAAETLAWGRQQQQQIKDNLDSAPFESLLAKILKDQEEGKIEAFTDSQLGFLGSGMVSAAVDTTAALFRTLLLCLAAHPTIQDKLRKEVDTTVGAMVPAGEDIEKLKYLKAVMLETMRWRPQTPLTLAHLLEADDSFGGYHLPKNTIVLNNAWAIHRNHQEYANPDTYNPERFLLHPYGMRTDNPECDPAKLEKEGRRVLYQFGAGRRACPGEQFALNAVAIAVSKILWAFEIVADGEVDLELDTAFSGGLVEEPKGLKLRFVLRGEEKRAALLEDLRRMDSVTNEVMG